MRRKLSLLGLFLSLLFFFTAAAAQKEESRITIYATVLNKMGDFILELKKNNFRLFDEKAEKKILAFSDRAEPVSVGFLIDLSGSMGPITERPSRFSRIKEGIFEFINNSDKENEYFLITFNVKINMLQDFTRNGEDIKKALADESKFQAKGYTKVNDAIYAALKKVSEGVHRKKVLIVATDAQDNESAYKYKELRQAARDSETLIYIVDIQGTNFIEFRSGSTSEISRIGGGKTFTAIDVDNTLRFPPTKDVFSRIAEELKNQYTIRFEASPADEKNEWREIELKIDIPREIKKKIGTLFVRTRQGYYPVSDAVAGRRN